MRLPRGAELALDAEVNLDVRTLEPCSAARGHRRRLGPLWDTEHASIEGPRLGLLAGRHRQLDVIDADDPHVASLTPASAARPGRPYARRRGRASPPAPDRAHARAARGVPPAGRGARCRAPPRACRA